jgi:hypothetical protein
MKYNGQPIYKYLLTLFIISLFIFHQKTSLDVFKILLFSTVLTSFCVIADFVFIKDHPNIFRYVTKKNYDNAYTEETIDTDDYENTHESYHYSPSQQNKYY